ncbi:MAG: hypothetical protein M3460_23840 [Actinomycetota bacterium]|nr:hypothetical protein [Actinomycetota bacterium]
MTDNALWVLSHLWYDLDERDTVAAAVTNAQTKLPVIEIAIISASVLYGLHLLVTKGVKRNSLKVQYHPDGSYTETTTTDYYMPASALRLAAHSQGPTGGSSPQP